MASKKRKTKKLKCGCPTHRFFICINCSKPTCPEELGKNNNCYCDACWAKVCNGVPLDYSVKCVIPGCLNRTDQGGFNGDLCSPCHSYLITGKGTHSQAYRNELVKANFRILADMNWRPSWSAFPFRTLAVYGNRSR